MQCVHRDGDERGGAGCLQADGPQELLFPRNLGRLREEAVEAWRVDLPLHAREEVLEQDVLREEA
eukprot:13248477-Alexandrium_andersonii.AAC.1